MADKQAAAIERIGKLAKDKDYVGILAGAFAQQKEMTAIIDFVDKRNKEFKQKCRLLLAEAAKAFDTVKGAIDEEQVSAHVVEEFRRLFNAATQQVREQESWASDGRNVVALIGKIVE